MLYTPIHDPVQDNNLFKPTHSGLPITNDVTHVYCLTENRGRTAVQDFLRKWWIPIVHCIYVTFTTFFTVYWLNGRLFAVNGTSGGFVLTQPWVTTIFSICLVVNRMLSSAWQGLLIWQCIFLLLQTTGLSLSNIGYLTSMQWPDLRLLRRRGIEKGVIWLSILLMLLAMPAQFANPLAAGSLSWIPARSFQESQGFTLGTAVQGNPWSWYVTYATVRTNIIRQAAGLATLGVSSLNGIATSPVSSAQRMALQFGSLPNGTRVSGAVVPSFKISTFKWISDKDELPRDIYQSVKNIRSGFLNITDAMSPLVATVPGNAALLKDTAWSPPSAEKLPEPKSVCGTKYAAIYVSRNYNHGQVDQYDCRNGSSIFDPLPQQALLINVPWNNNYSDCLAVAKMEIEAGVTYCHQDDPMTCAEDSTCYLSPRSSSIVVSENSTVMPDQLVLEVLSMMPEVQSLSAGLGLLDPGAFRGSVDLYLQNSLIQAYQGTWSAMVSFLSQDLPEGSTGQFWRSYGVLRVRIIIWRMILWFILNLLLVLLAPGLWVLQLKYGGKAVRDPLVTAVLLDCSAITDSVTHISCEYIGQKTQKLEVTSINEDYHLDGQSENRVRRCCYPKLVPQ